MKKLYLDTQESNFLSLTSNNADAQWLLPDVTSLLATHYSIELIDCSIPITQPAFYAGRNTTFEFKENGGGLLTCEIDEGTYSGTQIASHIATQMTGAVGATLSYAGSYSDITKKLTIYTTLPDTFSIEDSSTCLAELGFSSDGSADAATHTGVNVVNLNGTRYLDIVCNFNTQSVAPNGRRNILHRIHLTEPVGSVAFFENNFNESTVTVSSESLRMIELRLYDQDGTIYNIPDNHRVTYTVLMRPLD